DRNQPAPKQPPPEPAASSGPGSSRRELIVGGAGILLLGTLLVSLHGAALRFPFLADDYACLDQARSGLVGSVVRAFTGTLTYNFRPIVRELYFWLLATVTGINALA